MSARRSFVGLSAADARPSNATQVQPDQLRLLADLLDEQKRIEAQWKEITTKVDEIKGNLGLPTAPEPSSSVRHIRHTSLPPITGGVPSRSFKERAPAELTAEEAGAAIQQARHNYLSLQKELLDTKEELRESREQITRLEAAQNNNTETRVFELQDQVTVLQKAIDQEREKYQSLQVTHIKHMEHCGRPQAETKRDSVDYAKAVNAVQTLRALKENPQLRVSSSRMSLRSQNSRLSLQSAATTSAIPSGSPATTSVNKTRSRHTLPATTLASIPQERTRTTSTSTPNTALKKLPPKRSEYLSSFPAARRAELEQLPQVQILEDGIRKCNLTRAGLKERLGGSPQSLIIRVTASQTSLGKKHNVTLMLCPNLDQNPWCPTRPGEHGYMFVGLTSEKETFRHEEHASLFVGDHENSTSSSSKRLYAYMGEYRAVRVPALPVDEWKSLSLHVRQQYAQTTKKRVDGTGSIESYLAQYDRGEMQVPCVRLQCVGFNHELHNGLIGGDSSDTSLFTVKIPKRPRTESNVLESPHQPKSSRSS